jgi:hypothetical protein
MSRPFAAAAVKADAPGEQSDLGFPRWRFAQ